MINLKEIKKRKNKTYLKQDLTYKNIYFQVLKNQKNYNLIFYNMNYNIAFMLNLNYNLNLVNNYILYIKLIKKFLKENGLKILLLENWYKFGVKYNLILKLLNYKIKEEVNKKEEKFKKLHYLKKIILEKIIDKNDKRKIEAWNKELNKKLRIVKQCIDNEKEQLIFKKIVIKLDERIKTLGDQNDLNKQMATLKLMYDDIENIFKAEIKEDLFIEEELKEKSIK